MAYAEQHPFVAQLEHVGARGIFAFVDAQICGKARVKKFSQIQSILEILRPHQSGIVSALPREGLNLRHAD